MTQDLLEDLPFGWSEYFNQTTLHPLAGVALVVMGVLTLALPRRHALGPTLVLVCFIPTAQRVVVFGLDFTLLRLMVVFGWLRILMRGELSQLRWQAPDTMMLAWALANFLAYTLLRGSGTAAIYVLGYTYEAVGLYLLVRCLIRTRSDLQSFTLTLVALSIATSIAFLHEKSTGRNLFAVFGSVPEITAIRQGRLRCQGAFPHPILAGCFWAGMVPYMGALWWRSGRRGRVASVVGVASATVIIITCASSTPVTGLAAGVLAALLYTIRYRMRELRYAVALCLVSLHLVMKAPVWHLLSRVDIAGGSTGWHRYSLVDQAIRRFPEWALFGTRSTGHWGFGLDDVTNQYVWEAVRGGLLGLSCFVIMMWIVFSLVGATWRRVTSDRAATATAWASGVALFIHAVHFIGVAYFGQVSFGWYFALGAIVSLSEASGFRVDQGCSASPPRWK